MQAIQRPAVTIFVLILAVLTSGSAFAAPKPPAPEGLDQFLVFMANGVFDPTSPNPNPEITGCSFMFCDGPYFQEQIMGWDPGQIAAEEAAAKLFYLERFGVDVDSMVASGQVSFFSFSIDPRIEYRAYHVAGRRVPPGGWEVRDGGFLLVVIDPEGLELGGEFAGEHVPVGTSMAYGAYNIATVRPNGRPGRDIIIRYQSPQPNLPVEGPVGFVCEIETRNWGSGLAQGIVAHMPLADGLLQFNVRNVLTYPGFPE